MKGLLEELNEKEKILYNAKRDLLLHKAKIHEQCQFLWKYTAIVDGVRQTMAGVYVTKEDAAKEFNKWSSSTIASVSDPEYFQVESIFVPLDEIKRAFFYSTGCKHPPGPSLTKSGSFTHTMVRSCPDAESPQPPWCALERAMTSSFLDTSVTTSSPQRLTGL
jgi:hypothetical protein